MTEDRGIAEAGWNLDNSYAHLPEIFYTKLNPTPVPLPGLAILNNSLAEALGLNPELLQSDEGIAVLAGNLVPEGVQPLAQAYAGHQFGYFTMLGDGRALLLGEQLTSSGERFDIQFKGSGRTPYSRGGDGRAALGPMLREYIISEAMYALGIPTTRSLAAVTTGEAVFRETMLPGAVLTRVASSHLRVGTFQFASQWASEHDLRALADYTIQRHFNGIENEDNRYLGFLQQMIQRQAGLIAKWQLVGFIHGVMNTDNMTISGETIDYGPCAFMDIYDPATVFSSIDTYGRYAYGKQPEIGAWNLARFAEALLPLLDSDRDKALELAQGAVSSFAGLYRKSWLTGMSGKLGIYNEEPEDEKLFEELLNLMYKYHADYTNTFAAITFDQQAGTDLFGSEEFTDWHKKWVLRLERQQKPKESCRQLMKKSNPAVIPRNHRVEEALEAAVKHQDYIMMKRLLDILSDPYAHSHRQLEYAALPAPSNCRYRTFCGT